MITLYLLQAFVPLVLMAWLALVLPRSTIGIWVQALATGVGFWRLRQKGLAPLTLCVRPRSRRLTKA